MVRHSIWRICIRKWVIGQRAKTTTISWNSICVAIWRNHVLALIVRLHVSITMAKKSVLVREGERAMSDYMIHSTDSRQFLIVFYLLLTLGSTNDTEPIYTNGRIYFNMTGDVCNTATNETYNLLVILACDYSSQTANPVVMMPYVRCWFDFIFSWKR